MGEFDLLLLKHGKRSGTFTTWKNRIN